MSNKTHSCSLQYAQISRDVLVCLVAHGGGGTSCLCCRKCCSVVCRFTRKQKRLHAETFPCLFSLFFFFNFQQPEKLSSSLKSGGICQPQTELIALNHSRSLKVSGRGDVIIGVAEVAWESCEILSLTFPSTAVYPIRLINHPFRLISSTPGLTWENALGPGCSPRGPDVMSCVCASVCTCVCENSPNPASG